MPGSRLVYLIGSVKTGRPGTKEHIIWNISGQEMGGSCIFRNGDCTITDFEDMARYLAGLWPREYYKGVI